MKVLFITKSDLSGTAGHNIATREIVAAFARHDSINLSLVCPEPINSDSASILGDINTFYIGKRPANLSLPHRVFSTFDMFRTLRQAILQIDPDLLVARMAPILLAPAVLTHHHDIPYALLSRGTGYKSLRFSGLLTQIYKYNVRAADQVFAASGKIKRDTDQLRKKDQPLTEFLPNAVDIKKFSPLDRGRARKSISPELGNDFIVGFVGSMKSYHRLDYLIQSLNHIKIEEAKFLLVGDGPERETYEQLAGDQGFGESVIFPGFVSHSEVSKYISACDVLYGVSDQESATPVKVFEYLACARPVIVRDIAELDFIRDQDLGRTVNPSSKSVGNAIQQLYDVGMDRREAMGKRGRQYIKANYTWDRAATQVIEVFQDS